MDNKKYYIRINKLFKEDLSAVLTVQGLSSSLSIGIEGEREDGFIDPLLSLCNINKNDLITVVG